LAVVTIPTAANPLLQGMERQEWKTRMDYYDEKEWLRFMEGEDPELTAE
jgi:hypothetical protein